MSDSLDDIHEIAREAIRQLRCICGHKLHEHGKNGYDCWVKNCTCPLFRTQKR